jgi:hypothetical protein
MSSHAGQSDAAREATRTLWERGIKAEIPLDLHTHQFADAALSELERLQVSTPRILKDVLPGIQAAAAQSFDGGLQRTKEEASAERIG